MSLVTQITGAPALNTALSIVSLGVPSATTIGTLSTSLSQLAGPIMLTQINTGFAGPPGNSIYIGPLPPLNPPIGQLWLDIS